jgi:hypothetical protein
LDCANELRTDTGTAESAASASANARVGLVNMVIRLVLKPEPASTNQIEEPGV